MVIWEKDREIDPLRKQLVAKNVAVGLPLQPLMGQSTGAYGTNVVAPTIGSQRTVSFQPIKTSPVVTSCVTLPTTLPREQTATTSQLPGIIRGQSLPQLFRETRDPVQVTTSFVLPTVSHHTGIPSMSLPDQRRGTVTSSWTPQTVSYSAYPVVQTDLLGFNPSVMRGVPPAPLTEPLVHRQGKAPPIDSFTGEDNEVRFDDWIPTLERAATWNNWTDEETLMQLAGYLCGRVLQEWNLLTYAECSTYQSAITALRT